MLADEIVKRLRMGGKILICGNGGLAAESEHFAAEIVGSFVKPVYGQAIALTCPSALTTALANDMGFDNVYSHQVEVFGSCDDVFIGMTTSKSANILKALDTAKELGLLTFMIAPERFDADYHCSLIDGTVAEKQNRAIKVLHELATEIKERLFVNSKPE